MDETFELDDIEDIDSLADEEVEKVFLEVTAGVMDKAAPAGRTALPQPEPEPEPEPEPIPRVSELDASLEAPSSSALIKAAVMSVRALRATLVSPHAK